MTIGELSQKIAEEYKKAIIDSNSVSSGKLLDFTYDFEVGRDYYRIYFTMPVYWKYIEEGTRPHFPPLDAIKEWIRIKPIIPYPDKYGKIPSTNSVAYMVAKKISEEGTQPKNLLEKTILQCEPYIEEFVQSLGERLEVEISTIIKNIHTTYVLY